ncbi:GGDEF domain-containing protein [Clostridium sp. LIBA-8841]|uniref:GGDEF domain-containing protein n=1 Tax=Clostridium sp. LIBA-8841 TaxID=2987530 RepID=UPI002AC7A53F|nr:GGDEF domain-containing protein [Clostridium sp. LIBA-8841]MDZ5252414.1 GGDEF domain-containing protein [Clostridium sp. LIBA-8841]
MKNKCKVLDGLFLTLLLEISVLLIILSLRLKSLNLEDFILIGIIIVISFFAYLKGSIFSIISSIITIFIYASLNLYNNFVKLEEVSPNVYIWIIFIPIITITVGCFSTVLNQIQEEYMKIKESHESLVTIDKRTGLSNLRGFYQDIGRGMSRAKRRGYPLTLMIITFPYFNEFKSILDPNSLKELEVDIADALSSSVRNEDMTYKFGEDYFAVLMEETDLKGAEVVKRRLKEKLQNISKRVKNKDESIMLEVKIGIAQYDENIKNAIEFKEIAERELEFDV